MTMITIYPAFISFQEIVIVMLAVVVIFGPKKIPEIARGLGEGIKTLKRATEDLKKEILDPIEDIDPTKEIRDSIEEAKKGLDDSMDNNLGGSVKR